MERRDRCVGATMSDGTRIIGRSRSADLVIASAKVSRRHCSLITSGSGFVLQDHDSRNGVWVKGRRVKTAFLKCGDRFTVGNYRVLIAGDGSLVLECKVDPKQVMFRERLRRDLPAIYAITIFCLIGLGIYLTRDRVIEESPIVATSEAGDTLPIWTPDKKPEPDPEPVTVASTEDNLEAISDAGSPLSANWVTSNGRSWSLEELLALAEAIEATDQQPEEEQPVVATGTSKVEAESDKLELPPSIDPWAEVARLRRDKKLRRRRGRPSTSVAPETQVGPTAGTAVNSSMSASEWLELGREALATYHLPDQVLPRFIMAIDALFEIRSDESWKNLDTLRKEARDLLRSVAGRARQIGQKYGHLDRNPDAPLSAQQRREAELALNLLVLIQEQMEILLDARDAAFDAMTDPDDTEMLIFALNAAIEANDDELLDVVLELTIDNKAPESIPPLIKALKVAAATRKLKVLTALREITGKHFSSGAEWESWWNTREGSPN